MSTVSELSTMRPTWAEIDAAAFGRNLATVASRLPEGSRLIAVMKANAYGHGAAELANECTPDRVAMIAVVMLEEAMELRRAGVTTPLLILGPLSEAQVRIAAENGIDVGIPGPEELVAATRVARDRDVVIHLKIDSGMGRMGSIEGELPRIVELVRSAPRIKVAALYTHYANSGDPDDPFTDQQSARFDTLVQTLAEAGLSAPLRHRANSAAMMRGIVKPGEYARVGIALYGAEALDAGESRLEPVMRWRTEIVRLKDLPKGHAVGYGMTFRTERPTRLATLPVGYADGYNRLLSNKGDVLVGGRRAPVVGRVSMDLITVDVTDIPGAACGDEVILLGRQGDEEVTVEEIAAKIGTISYEVLCGVSARVPRVYRVDGRATVRSRFQ
ncbi:MAG TPA: alanine racemase [Thermoanaerobaculia bacterium]|nr:alanine racemase [Thermoanaerobaculia bacterium]